MKLKLITIVFTLILIGCQKDELKLNIICHQMKTNPSYIKEDFKPNYTIQFPENYEGEGLYFPDEAPTFYKTSMENIVYSYEIPCDTDCHIYFGQILENPTPNQIEYSDFSNQYYGVILDKTIEFCKEQEKYMILYYNSGEFNKSKLFIKEDDKFKEGLIVDFEVQQIEDVIDILKTIKKM